MVIMVGINIFLLFRNQDKNLQVKGNVIYKL